MEYILASLSPRRRELLELIMPRFGYCDAGIEETCPDDIPLFKRPEYLAVKKAEAVAVNNPDIFVIGADTAVFYAGEMLGKPKDRDEAFKMLKRLSGKRHTVITGCAIICKGKKMSFSCKTEVKFLKLQDNEINAYIATGEPYDKAGAYGIQGYGALLVSEINGDFYNVMGLPVSMLNQKLKEFTKRILK